MAISFPSSSSSSSSSSFFPFAASSTIRGLVFTDSSDSFFFAHLSLGYPRISQGVAHVSPILNSHSCAAL